MFTKYHITKEQIEAIVNTSINRIELYAQAFVHKSVILLTHRFPDNLCLPAYKLSNERFEFLGDSVLSMVCATYLYMKYPDRTEGFLTRMRTKMVNDGQLAHMAKELGFDQYMLTYLGISRQLPREWVEKLLPADDKSHLKYDEFTNDNPKVLEDAFEAFIGAFYLDKGIFYAERFLYHLFDKFMDLKSLEVNDNYKDILSRYCQRTHSDIPRYITNSVDENPDRSSHQRWIYTCSVKIEQLILTDGVTTIRNIFIPGQGLGKKEAEQAAAQAVIRTYNIPDMPNNA